MGAAVVSRRRALQGSAAALISAALIDPLHGARAAPSSGALITKAIPSTGEKLAVIGVGTNRYGVDTPHELAARREVLKKMPVLGLSVVDTAPGYGRSERVI